MRIEDRYDIANLIFWELSKSNLIEVTKKDACLTISIKPEYERYSGRRFRIEVDDIYEYEDDDDA